MEKYLKYEKEHLSTIRELLPECTVLLKSDGNFPLKEPCRLALYGSGARNTVKGGTGSGEVNSHTTETIEQGLQKAGFVLTTGKWLDSYDLQFARAKKEFKKTINARAKELHTQSLVVGMGMTMPEPEYELPVDAPGELAIYVLARKSGEGQDRQVVKGDLFLTDTEIRDILACAARYPKFMLVLNVGGPVDLSPVMDVPNILVLSQLGTMCGTALADILLGKQSPSGKLATTWAAWNDYPQMIDFGDINNTRYYEGIYVGYRYFDTMGVKPLFPFGFGLSYTTFALQCTGVEQQGANIEAKILVKNTGKCPGKEVAQLYISKPWGKLDQPRQELAAFAKTKELQPNEAQMLTLDFALPEIASYNAEKSAYVLEAGDYQLLLGDSSADTKLCAIAILEKDVCVRQVRPALGEADFTDFRPPKPHPVQHPSDVPAFAVDSTQIPCQTVCYDTLPKVPECIKHFSDEELVKACIGMFDSGDKSKRSVIGNAGQKVAGAAGQSAPVADIETLVMADGPAGLRLSRDYYVDKTGPHSMSNTIPESIQELMSPPLRFFTSLMYPKPPKNVEVLHQYATMIPIGTAIAQSWNTELAQTCGDIVGREMERFGVQLWLAPALNIHRSILGGRNFEYFSEDPYISGKMAAAITTGAQNHSPCGVTIKHFAANNQENNRYASNSIVSERAMREIYLKGFELCIREAKPKALMTSYNLINGIHASERYDLIVDILRSEFGFDGIVMTDWMTGAGVLVRGNNPIAKAEKIIAAGGTLIMPGSKKDYSAVLKALRSNILPRSILEQAAAALYAVSAKLTL